jgi:hypothetical protein
VCRRERGRVTLFATQTLLPISVWIYGARRWEGCRMCWRGGQPGVIELLRHAYIESAVILWWMRKWQEGMCPGEAAGVACHTEGLPEFLLSLQKNQTGETGLLTVARFLNMRKIIYLDVCFVKRDKSFVQRICQCVKKHRHTRQGVNTHSTRYGRYEINSFSIRHLQPLQVSAASF